MKENLKYLLVLIVMMTGLFATAQQCNYAGTTDGYDQDNYHFIVDMSCVPAGNNIDNVVINNFVDHYSSPGGSTGWCGNWWNFDIVINGNVEAAGQCGGDIMAFDYSQFAPITSLEFVIHDLDNWYDHVYVDIDADMFYSTSGGGGAGNFNCTLDCPGDMVVYLDPGDCCWAAQYNARTEGDCATNYDTILVQPVPQNGFVNTFDPTNYPEWDPSTTAFGTVAQGPFLLNGPGSVVTGAAAGYTTWSAFDMTNLPTELKFYGRTRYDSPGQCANTGGDGALYNYTMINFIAPYTGSITFNWDYHTDNANGPYYDRFGYMTNGNWNPYNAIIDIFGNNDQSGTFTRHMNEGQSITLFIWGLYDGDCSANVNLSNLVYSADPYTDGIVLVDGPAIGDPICDGETQTVKLHLLEGGQAIDSCLFDITVHEYQNPTTTLACNDHVQISVDDNCVGMVLPDMILEGGPYGCYDDYTVQIFSSMPDNVTGAIGDIPNPAPLGNWVVGIYDETGNNCWSTITVLDKIPPTIECACPVGGEFPAGSVAP
ncbi:MAG TPA: hypothetical protein ENI82_01240, partial [Bacteroidetes bacterium]|nr:hypothetical protein [Bacteroidota bacterium]